MEPEEIDKLFKNRLAGLPAVPSPDAWQRLQQKMEPPKKERTLWIYYAAASVVILLLSGILLIRNNNQNQAPGLANNKQHETKLPPVKNTNPVIIEENKLETKIAEQTVTAPETPGSTSTEQADKAEIIAPARLATSTPKETPEKLKNKMPKVNKQSPYLAASKQGPNSPSNNAEYKITTNKGLDHAAPKAFSLVDNSEPVSESALTATIVEVTVKKESVEQPAGEDQNLRENLARKTTLLKNIYKQARNLKNGEPVELTALGVDKEKLEAETKEIKQKINKVISL